MSLLSKELWAFSPICVWNMARGPLPTGIPRGVTTRAGKHSSSENRKFSRQLFREV